MSTVFFNVIAVTDPRNAALRFRCDARLRLSPAYRACGLSHIELSFEKLLRLHPGLRFADRRIPDDHGHYWAELLPKIRWHGYTRLQDELEVKNTQIHEMLLPLSRCYLELCFVNSELCLDDGSTTSICTRRGDGSNGTFLMTEEKLIGKVQQKHMGFESWKRHTTMTRFNPTSIEGC